MVTGSEGRQVQDGPRGSTRCRRSRQPGTPSGPASRRRRAACPWYPRSCTGHGCSRCCRRRAACSTSPRCSLSREPSPHNVVGGGELPTSALKSSQCTTSVRPSARPPVRVPAALVCPCLPVCLPIPPSPPSVRPSVPLSLSPPPRPSPSILGGPTCRRARDGPFGRVELAPTRDARERPVVVPGVPAVEAIP